MIGAMVLPRRISLQRQRVMNEGGTVKGVHREGGFVVGGVFGIEQRVARIARNRDLVLERAGCARSCRHGNTGRIEPTAQGLPSFPLRLHYARRDVGSTVQHGSAASAHSSVAAGPKPCGVGWHITNARVCDGRQSPGSRMNQPRGLALDQRKAADAHRLAG